MMITTVVYIVLCSQCAVKEEYTDRVMPRPDRLMPRPEEITERAYGGVKEM